MFAIIETGGKQYKVSEGDVIYVEKLNVAEEETVTFDRVIAVSGETFVAGTPTVAGATVTAKVLKNGKGKKIYIMKYKSKKNEKKKIGQEAVHKGSDREDSILRKCKNRFLQMQQ